MRGIHSTPEQRAKLHGLSSYANQTFGRPLNGTQCVGCGRMSIPGIVAIAVNASGFCPKCAKLREPHRDVIHLFKPLRRS